MLIRIAAILLGFILHFAAISGSQAETLAVLWKKVADTHPKVLGAKARVEIARERANQAQGAFYPRIGLQSDLARAKNESLNVRSAETIHQTDATIRFNLFNGFADVARRDSSIKDIAASQSDLGDNLEELALLLSETYIHALSLERQTLNAQSLVSDLSVLADTVKSSVSIGRSPESDLIQATTKVLQARGNLSDVRGRLAGARSRLNALVGAPVGELIEPAMDERPFAQPVTGLMSTARERNPQWKAARQRGAQAIDEVNVAKGELYPKINLEGRKNIQRDGPAALVSTLEREALVQFNYEYALGRTPYHRVNEARARQLAAEAFSKEVEIDLQAQIGEARESLLEHVSISQQLLDRQRAAAGVFDAYRWQFNAGRRTLLDLITVREDQYLSGEAVTANRRDRLLSVARLHRLVGQLRSQLSKAETGAAPGQLTPGDVQRENPDDPVLKLERSLK